MDRYDRAASRAYVETHGFCPERIYTADTRPPRLVRVLGQIAYVEYVSRKDFELDDDGRPGIFNFHHDFELPRKPWLASGQGRFFVLGGGYTVTPHGIEDDESDPRDLPTGERFAADLRIPKSVTGMGTMHAFGLVGRSRPILVDGQRHLLAYSHGGARRRLFVVPVKPGSGRKA